MGSGLVGGKARASLSSLATIGKSLLASGDGVAAAGPGGGVSAGVTSHAKRGSVVFGIDDEDEDEAEADYRPPADFVGGADGDADEAAGGRPRSGEARAGASAERPLLCRHGGLTQLALPCVHLAFCKASAVCGDYVWIVQHAGSD